MKQLVRIGLDIAKSVFQLHGVDCHGKPVCKKTLSRGEVLTFWLREPSTEWLPEPYRLSIFNRSTSDFPP
jgi:hypothetical protein